MNENLARWTMASISYHFSLVATTLGLDFFVEGVDERDPDNMNKEHAELRINGPFVSELSNGYYRVNVDINVLLTDYMRMSSENAYDIADWGGTFLTTMLKPIPIYKYGPGVEDDNTLIGCLTQRKGFSEPIRLLHFGQISRDNRVRQAAVDGRFSMFISE